MAQFGPETFGAAWDYEFCFDRARGLPEKRRDATLAAWLACAPCRVGAANRQVQTTPL